MTIAMHAEPETIRPADRRACVVLTTLLLLAAMAPGGSAVAGTPERSASASPSLNPVTPTESPRLQELTAYYAESVAARQYHEAETAAKQRIEYLIEADASSPSAMADALMDLAFAQRQIEQYDAALQNYLASVSLLERTGNLLSDELIRPLREIGDTYMAAGQAELALPAYERALHLSHVNAGPHNLDQAETLDAMSMAEAAAGRFDAALAVNDRLAALYGRRFGSSSEEMLPVLQRRAAMLNSLERHQDERMVHLDIVRIIERHRGESDVSLIEPYTAIGRTYLEEAGEVVFRSEPTGQTGETFLRKAVEVAERSPDAGRKIHALALIQLADYYTVLDVQDKARQNYRAAWRMLSTEAALLEERKTTLEQVVTLLHPPLDDHANFGYRGGAGEPGDADRLEGYIVARFTVTKRGRATDIEIIEAAPADFAEMQTRMQRTLRESVYRPRYQDGDPVRAEGQMFRHDFLYSK